MWSQRADEADLVNLDRGFEFRSVVTVTQPEPGRRRPQQCMLFAAARPPPESSQGEGRRVPRLPTGVSPHPQGCCAPAARGIPARQGPGLGRGLRGRGREAAGVGGRYVVSASGSDQSTLGVYEADRFFPQNAQ